jgi:membrane protein
MGLTVVVALIVIGALFSLFAGDFAAKHFQGSYGVSIVIRIVAWTMASLVMVLSFEVMCYLCPDVQHRRWRWFTPGAVIGLAGWIAGSIGLRVYLHYFNNYSVTYGSLGAVVILLMWFYVTGVTILLGGEVNSEVEHAVAERELKTGACTLPPESAVSKVDLRQ